MNKVLIGVIIGIIVITGIFYAKKTIPNTQSVSTPTGIPISTVPDQYVKTSPDTNLLKAGGSSYSDSDNVFSMLYPNDYVLDTNDPKHIRIYKRGATQKGQTEIYDGVLIVFEPVKLQGKSLEEYTDTEIANLVADGASKITEAKNQVLLNTYPGFSFSVHGFGDSEHLIIQKDSASNFALNITFTINDPQNKNYISEVETILSVLTLNK